MLRLSCKITVTPDTGKKIIFDFVNEIETNEGYENLTDTCKIIVPRNVSMEGKPLAIGNEALFKRGMAIKVECGYDGKLKTIFTGFISHVNLSIPVTLECEDRMWLLKKNALAAKSYSTVSLKTLLAYIMPSNVSYTTDGFSFENLGKVRINKGATTAMVLDMLRKNFQIYSFFRNDKLYVGLAFHESLQKTKTFGFESNVIDDKGLEWIDNDEVKIKVVGTSIQSDNTKRTYTYPVAYLNDPSIPATKYTCPNLGQADLEANVKRLYDSFQYDGYKGTFVTFGEPFVNHGDKIGFTGEKLPERNEGLYLVRSVKRNFGQSGYRQTPELANKVVNG